MDQFKQKRYQEISCISTKARSGVAGFGDFLDFGQLFKAFGNS